jgi:hypothetical protein
MSREEAGESAEDIKSPDFTIKDATYVEEREQQQQQQAKPSTTLKHSRSFKTGNSNVLLRTGNSNVLLRTGNSNVLLRTGNSNVYPKASNSVLPKSSNSSVLLKASAVSDRPGANRTGNTTSVPPPAIVVDSNISSATERNPVIMQGSTLSVPSYHHINNRTSNHDISPSVVGTAPLPVVGTAPLPVNSNSSSDECKVMPERVDSAYGTDSNRTASRNTESSGGGGAGSAGGGFFFAATDKSPIGSAGSPLPLNISGSPPSPLVRSGHFQQQLDRSGGSSSIHNRSGSSVAFNNETYMSIENASLVAATEEEAADASYVSVSSPLGQRMVGGAEASHNNTYQSVHPLTEEATVGDLNASHSSRITVVDQQGVSTGAAATMTSSTPRRPQQQQQQNLLKRSPVLKDVTAAVAGPLSASSRMSTAAGPMQDRTAAPSLSAGNFNASKERLHAPLTIIIPNISHQAVNISKATSNSNSNGNSSSNIKSNRSSATSPDKWSDKTIPLDILNPESGPPDISGFAGHDYENLALVNINRAPLGGHHWRTYSDMATGRHDDSTKYEKNRLNFTSSSDYR